MTPDSAGRIPRATRGCGAWAVLATLVSLLGAAPAASAQDPEQADAAEPTSLESALSFVVGTAVRGGVQVSLAEAPAIIEVIDRRTIQDSGARTVAELLRDVAGLYVIDDHLLARVGVRGVFGGAETSNEMVKVMVNGQPVDVRTTSSAFLKQSLIPIDAIERIELVRGAASAMYGANALLGVINIITTETNDSDERYRGAHRVYLSGVKGPAEGRGMEVSASSSRQYDYFSYTVAAGYGTADRSGLALPGEEDLLRQVAADAGNDRFDEPVGSPSPGSISTGRSALAARGRSEGDVERLASFFGGVTYEIDDDLFVSGQAVVQYHDNHGEFQSWSTLSHANRFAYLNATGRLSVERRVRNGLGWGVKGSLGVAIGRPTGKESLNDPFLRTIERQRQVGYRALEGSLEATYGWGSGSLVIGADAVLDAEETQRIRTESTLTGVSNVLGMGEDKNFLGVGAFTQLMWRVKPLPLSFTAAVRSDVNNRVACDPDQWDCFGDHPRSDLSGGFAQLSMRAAAVYNMSVIPLDFKLIYGSSYKPPSPYQFEHEPITSQSSPGIADLLPQTADTFELFVRARPTSTLEFNATLFENDIANSLLFLTENSRPTTRNADAMTRGLEVGAGYRPTPALSLAGNLTYLFVNEVRPERRADETDVQWNSNPANADREPGAFPRLMANAIVTLRLPEPGVTWTTRIRYVGERSAQLSNAALAAVDWEPYTFGDYVAVDTNLSYAWYAWSRERPTVVSLRVWAAPGGYADAGAGGVDIPSWTPLAYLSLSQDL